MSLSRIDYNRKRRSDDESSSSDSDEDARPVKRSRALSRERNARNFVARKFHKWVSSIYRLNIGYNDARERMLKNAIDWHVPVEVEETDESEEEEDIDVVEINSEDDDGILEDYTSDRSSSKDGLSREPIPVITFPPSSSAPLYRGCNGSRGRPLNSLSRQPVNGCNSAKTFATRSKADSSNHQKVKNFRNIAPLTNPCLDVEVLLDTRETPGEESDDLEIVSEISNTKSLRRLTRQTISPAISEFGQTSNECNGTSSGTIVNRMAASCERRRSLNNLSTAYEVFRLQEKQDYQELLDKMVNTSTYHFIVPKKDTKPVEVIDLISDDEPVIGGRLKQEVLEKPVNEFLQKYYKSGNYQPCAPPKASSEVEIFTLDDDVQVIETKKSDDDCYKYKPKICKEPGTFSDEWLNKFKKDIDLETKRQLQIVSSQEDKVERYRKRREAKILKEKILRGLSISSDQPEEDEFPELTQDMEDRIDWALAGGSPLDTLSTFKDCICTRADIVTLAGLNWLNDSVINFYLALVMERGKDHPKYPPVYAFNSYFFSSLKNRGPKAVMRWTRKIEDSKNIFQFDILFVPLHLGMHWALCVIDNRMKKIKYYDSMQGKDDQCLGILQNYLVVEKKEKLGIVMDPSAYSLEIVKDIPQQMNGSDCGMFTLKYAEYISRDAAITFSQEHMQYFRRRMVLEILDKKLF